MFRFYCFLSLFIAAFCSNKVVMECGVEYKPSSEQIFNGASLERHRHPWFCDFDFEHDDEGLRHCGGVLISEEDILTSASCFDDSKLPHQKVRNLRCGSAGDMVPLEALDVRQHAAFEKHRLARIRIKKVAFSTIIRPVCLTKNEKVVEESPVTVIGSGSLYPFGDSKSEDPRKAEIRVRSFSTCQKLYNISLNKLNATLCAGEFMVGIRPGDEGTPLLAFYGDRYYLIGIVATPRDEIPNAFNQAWYPVLFTRVAAYCNNFIVDHTAIQCHNNKVPIEATGKGFSCGAVSEARMKKRATGQGLPLLQPWFCKIGENTCGGTIISPKYVITAAHCARPSSNLTLHCGIDLQTIATVAGITIHSEYNSEMYYANDIAILELKERIDFDGSVGAVCLAEDDKIETGQDDLIAVGSDEGKRLSVKSIKLKVSNNTNCEAELNIKTNVLRTLCLESDTSSTKPGDSGGPLLSKINDRWHIVGIVSGGKEHNDIPTNYIHFTRVSGFSGFITQATKNHVYWSTKNVSSTSRSSSNITLITLFLPFFITIYKK